MPNMTDKQRDMSEVTYLAARIDMSRGVEPAMQMLSEAINSVCCM